MQATDVMTRLVITVQGDTEVQEIARLLLKHRISAVPVVDADQNILGIVSEGDLMRRAETGTDSRHSWWLEAIFSSRNKTEDYIKTHGRMARDVMTSSVISVTADTPLHEIASLLEKHQIKRVPVTSDGRMVGIVSRANLLQGLAAKGAESNGSADTDDQLIRHAVLEELSNVPGLDRPWMNATVDDGVVRLWGIVDSDTEKRAAEVAAKSIPGVKTVENNLNQAPPWIWAE